MAEQRGPSAGLRRRLARHLSTGITALLLALLALPPAVAQAAGGAQPAAILAAEIRVPAGRFFTELGQDGTGFGIRNYADGPRFLDAFERFGGLAVLGLPSSRPWIDEGGFIYQLTQRALLQWSPAERTVRVANLYESLERRGFDAELLARHIPLPDPDDSGSFGEALTVRLGWLTDLAIAAAFAANPSNPGNLDASLALYGLPMSRPQRFGPFVVQRFQRTAFQHWIEAVDGGQPVGSVVLVNSGDHYKDLVLAGSLVARPQASDDVNLVDLRRDPPALVAAEPASPTERTYNVIDPVLSEALGLLEGVALNSEALDLTAGLDARLRFRPLPLRTLGIFTTPASIVLNADLRGEDRRVLAAVLAHELTHLLDFHQGRLGSSRQACLAAETRAIAREALTWGALVGPDGKQPPGSLLERVENSRLLAVQRGEGAVRDLVDVVYAHGC